MRGTWYQISLIFLGFLVTALFGVFFLRELFPEYAIYQDAYIELEKFRSTYTGEPPPPFAKGIKQILLETEGGGPEKIDRCTSCHVTLQFAHFSPTITATDINGNVVYDEKGLPVKAPNENYIWRKLDEKIDDLVSQGKQREAERYQALKTVQVGEHIYDMTKVLRMHPLIGRETRPFEYHPVDEYGCTVCHNGNGRGLTTDRAHGPVFDGQYEEQFMGPEPQFLEADAENDPQFSRVFNHKPGHRLLFQTSPLFVGDLIEAKCSQCHMTNDGKLEDAVREAQVAAERRMQQSQAIVKSYDNEKKAFLSLVNLRESIEGKGYEATLKQLRYQANDLTLPVQEMTAKGVQLDYLLRLTEGKSSPGKPFLIEPMDKQLVQMLGSRELLASFLEKGRQAGAKAESVLPIFIEENQGRPDAVGVLFLKKAALEKDTKEMFFVKDAEKKIGQTAESEAVLTAIQSNIDHLLENFHRGKSLFLSQACYACHRINGVARGGVGPELTNAGDSYPWFLKESIVWPQADLKTSTMPNFHLDHFEVEDLVTYLLAQHGRSRAVSEASYRKNILDWEAGAKQPWEKPINPGKLHDLRYSMTIFASEGCASCHRLKGFESNVGYRIEKESGKEQPGFDKIYAERQWFKTLFPEEIFGSDIVKAIEAHSGEIDRRIVGDVRENGLLEEINFSYPQLIESFYSNFRYASRAKNHFYEEKVTGANSPEEKLQAKREQQEWQDRVHRVLMMYIQEYGLGRLIGPRPNWSGIYRSDEWLIQHFRKPSRHTARSIMPAMPFDDSKFYALTYMLDELARRNRDEVRQIWENKGFNPELAYEIYCSQCHGEFLHGNGPVAEWIYPIPKNLRNADFLKNYTRENILNSILHGVKGTPMPPWGETAPDKPFKNINPVITQAEATQIVDWLFSSLLGGTTIPTEAEVPKWEYGPGDVIREMEKEGDELKLGPPPEFFDLKEREPETSYLFGPDASEYFAALDPVPLRIKAKGEGTQNVQNIFDVTPNPTGYPEKDLYYIKQKYFTENNIKAGQRFFELNCAVCHGREADGQGFRAGTMYDAKPRMLTNLHWIETRDDLRLLRSIKYGVPGTSMTPWGDQTSSLQRLQLVIFIRSLSLQQHLRDQLFDVLYAVFDEAEQRIDEARIEEYQRVNQIQDQLIALVENRAELFQKKQNEAEKASKAVSLYEQELSLNQRLQKHQEADQLLENLRKSVKEESDIYQRVGVTLLGKVEVGDTFGKYLELINVDNGQYTVKNGRLHAEFSQENEDKIQRLGDEILESLNLQIQETEKKVNLTQAKLPSQERKSRLKEVGSDLKGFIELKKALTSGLAETRRLRKNQKEIYESYLKELK